MAGFGKVLGKVAAGALALGGLILAGKTGFGKNLGEPEEEKDPLKLEPLGGPDEDEEEDIVPDEEGEDEEV